MCGLLIAEAPLAAQHELQGAQASVVALHVESSWIRDQTCVPCIGRWTLIHYTTREILPSSFKRNSEVDGQKLCLDGAAGCRLYAFFLSAQPKKNMERLLEGQVVPQPEMAEKPNTSRQRTWLDVRWLQLRGRQSTPLLSYITGRPSPSKDWLNHYEHN